MNLLARLRHAITGRCTWLIHDAETTITGKVCGPWRYCPVCQTTIVMLNEPPADHPESMTALPAEQEEWLAAVDRELWSKESA